MDQGPGTQAASGALRYDPGRARSLKGEGCIHVKRCRRIAEIHRAVCGRAGCMGTQHTGRIPGRIGAGCRLCRASGCMAVSGHPASDGPALDGARLYVADSGRWVSDGTVFHPETAIHFSWTTWLPTARISAVRQNRTAIWAILPGLWKTAHCPLWTLAWRGIAYFTIRRCTI